MGDGTLPLGFGTSRAAQVLAACIWATPLQSATSQSGAVGQQSFIPRVALPVTRTASGERIGPPSVGTANSMAFLLGEDRTYVRCTRPTTVSEFVVGELRNFGLLEKNWDGEGANAPNTVSLKSAVSFVRFLAQNQPTPTPMLHSNGLAGLFWEGQGLYADLEFLDNDHVAYYVERLGGKHKGVIPFDSKQMPDLFSILIRT